MRLFLILILLLAATKSPGDIFMQRVSSVSPPDYWAEARAAALRFEEQKASTEAWNAGIQLNQEQIMAAWQNYVPEDPYRVIDRAAVYAKGDHWMKFGGRIVEFLPEGIRVRGMCKSLNDPIHYYKFSGEFFVANFPYTNSSQILRDAEFSSFTAKEAGTYLLSETNAIPKLDYGIIATPPPPTSQELELVVSKAESVALRDQRNMDANAKSLKYNQEQASKGDAIGQLRMGERYLTGDGVEKDLVKARAYLSKAAAQGISSAAELLKKLPQ